MLVLLVLSVLNMIILLALAVVLWRAHSANSDKQGKRSEELRNTMRETLTEERRDVTSELEKIRNTLDEKIKGVHEGLGAIQHITDSVGSIKNTLSGVKTRGAWGEVQLEALLDEIFLPEQYEKQAAVRDHSRERVDFVIKLPRREGEAVLLPIDAKFPQSDYEKVLSASEKGDKEEIKKAQKGLHREVKRVAGTIREQYVAPPRTTEFAILYLPSEGLFAETARIPDLLNDLRREHNVVVAGPTTLTAVLNTIQLGYQLVKTEQHSREVWDTLKHVRLEFGKFGDWLEDVDKSLTAAGNKMDESKKRHRQMARALERVEKLGSATPAPDGGEEGEDA